MTRDELAPLRARYAAAIMGGTRAAGYDNARVEAAFATVRREDYLTPPPWRIVPPGQEGTSSRDPAKLYDDVLVVLDAGRGINNGQPSLHAGWMTAVDPRAGETVVQIGIGTGYYTAILAELVGPGGRVEAYEIEPALAALATARLAALPEVRVHAESGCGVALPVADIVYVSAGAAAPDPGWLRALRPGGRLVFPWQPGASTGQAMIVRRVEAGFRARLFMSVSFVGCIGAGIGEARPKPVLPIRSIDETRSVWLTAESQPDDTATAVYGDVWFSAREI